MVLVLQKKNEIERMDGMREAEILKRLQR